MDNQDPSTFNREIVGCNKYFTDLCGTDDASKCTIVLRQRVVVRKRWHFSLRQRVLAEILQNRLHGLFKLRIVAFAPKLGVHLDLNVRRDTFVLNSPVSFRGEKGEAWCSYTASVDERWVSSNA